jgi:hypothetical protein
VADDAQAAAMPPRLGAPESEDPRTDGLGRIGLLVFALLFQILTFLALFVAVHILRGHFHGSTYSSAQQVDAAVLGLPGVALGIGVLLAAIYTLFTGRRSGLVFKLVLAAVVLFAVSYGLELALK